MEPNLSSVGGIHFAPVAEQLVMRDIVPTLLGHDPGLVIEMPRDQRDLFIPCAGTVAHVSRTLVR